MALFRRPKLKRDAQRPRLYADLASWWRLVSDPADYAKEAALIRRILAEACARPPSTLLELGCGGGNNASHLKHHFQMTLVDLSPEMLAVSGNLNPECEHLEGDMRSLRLGRLFDAVLVHDAIMYMTDEKDLRAAMETSFAHCAPGGAALFVPDCLRETFTASTEHGGHDDDARGLRYLEWIQPPEPGQTTFEVQFVYVLRETDGSMRLEQDRHVMGLFSRDDWLRLLGEVGFRAQVVPAADRREMFIASRPRD